MSNLQIGNFDPKSNNCGGDKIFIDFEHLNWNIKKFPDKSKKKLSKLGRLKSILDKFEQVWRMLLRNRNKKI